MDPQNPPWRPAVLALGLLAVAAFCFRQGCLRAGATGGALPGRADVVRSVAFSDLLFILVGVLLAATAGVFLWVAIRDWRDRRRGDGD